MITCIPIYYRFQLKELVLFRLKARPTHTHTARLFADETKQIFLKVLGKLDI